jgi:hypothetical protein
VQHDGSRWRCLVARAVSRDWRCHFAAFALRKFCLLLPWQTRGFRESRAGILFRVETHGRMSHPLGTLVSPDNSNVRNTWPNLVFPDDDFARQYYYVLNW